MKLLPVFLTSCLIATASAQLVIPSDGTDGIFHPTSDIVIDLALAQSAVWTTPVPGPNAGIGTYDAEKWAIVFKYTSVDIPVGVTVTFKNHPTHAPVIWLVQGSVSIAGTLNLRGANGVSGPGSLIPAEPGPGGFRGGAGGPSGVGSGLGPGGGGQYANATYSSSYGNPQIIPLIGGSGAGAGGATLSGSGAGGAILIAAATNIQVNGLITALPGTAVYAAGSCGAIRLIADQVTGSGSLDAGTYSSVGRVRVEANSLSPTMTITPSTIRVAPGTTPIIFQSATAPTVRIVSVDGLPAPADPTAPLVAGADIAVEKNTPVTISLETRNFATAGAVVSVRRADKYGAVTVNNATFVSGNATQATWQLSLTLSPGFSTLQARATAP